MINERIGNDTPSEEPRDGKDLGKLTRRDFLGKTRIILTGAAANVLIPPILRDPLVASASEKTPAGHLPEKEHHETTDLNDWSARVVVGGFFGIVAGMMIKKVELGPGTVGTMTTLESARLIALKSSKNKSDQEAFGHDMKELKGAYPLVPVLVEIAHIASNIRVDANKIFDESNLAETESGSIMPSEDAEKKSWEEFYQKTTEELVDLMAQSSALSMLAPITTTYVSSSVTSSMHPAILEKLYRLKYSENVLRVQEELAGDSLKEGDVPHANYLKSKALEEAQKVMDGVGGELDLMLTVAGNTNGDAVLGDPPNIYSLFKKPQHFPAYSAIGFTTSEILTTCAALAFLKKAGVRGETKKFVKRFNEGQVKIIKSISQTIKDSRLRDVSLFGARAEAGKLFNDLQNVLNDEGLESLESDLINQIASIPSGAFRLDVKTILSHQWDAFVRKKQKTKDDELTGERFDYELFSDLLLRKGSLHGKGSKDDNQSEREHDSILRKELLGALASQDRKKIAKYINRMLDSRKATTQSDLGALFSKIMQQENENELVGKDDSEIKNTFLQAIKEMAANGLSKSGPDKAELERAFMNDDVEKLWSGLSEIEKEDVRQALMISTGEPSQHEEPGDGHGHSQNRILSHQAKEVLVALDTQIPAVPSLVHFVKHDILPLISATTDDPEKKIKRERDAILLMTDLISAFADNVAAYLFALASLEELYKENYGEDVLQNNKSLDRAISLTAIYSAVFGGSLSLLGNGPNFLQERPVGVIDDQGELRIHTEPRALPDTLKNPYGFVGSALVFGFGRSSIDNAAEGLELASV